MESNPYCTKAAVAVATITDTPLRFRPVTDADMPLINGLLQTAISRTCDYTAGGIFMWIDYFGYEYCVYRDTLFIKGRTENCRCETAFMLPVGSLPLDESVRLVLGYCRARCLPPVFSAVPDDRLDALVDALGGDCDIEPLDDWADYLYDIHSLATLSGKAMSKKRNHVNQFFKANPGWTLSPLGCEDLPDAIMFLESVGLGDKADDGMAVYEHSECRRVLEHYTSYPFEGAVLRLASGAIAAIAVGEVIGDTLYAHIEKIDRAVPGAGAAIGHLFARYMLARHPGLRYCNREEDCGDPGLRDAKMQYHPVALLYKYNVRCTRKLE